MQHHVCKHFFSPTRFVMDREAIARSSDSLHFGPVLDILDLVRGEIGRPLEVLDIGSASCALRGMLDYRGIPCVYTALDREHPFLVQGRGNYGVDRLVRGNLHTLPFSPFSFDAVVAMGILVWVDMKDLPTILRSVFSLARRVCILNFLAPPVGTNSIRAKGASGRVDFVTLLHPEHFFKLLEQEGIDMPSHALGWSAPLNVNSDFPTYRGLPYRRECIYCWRTGGDG